MKEPRQRENYSPPVPSTLLQASQACVSCGSCISVCPVYSIEPEEALVARGKLRLIRELCNGVLTPSRDLAGVLSQCLLCGRCTDNCPNKALSMESIRDARDYLNRQLMRGSLKDLVLDKTLPYKERKDKLARLGRLAQTLIPKDSGLALRFPNGDYIGRLPRVSEKPFMKSAPRIIQGPKGAPRLGFFAGCVTNYLRPELGRKALEILSRRYTVIIPDGQGCCGLPAISAGLGEAALRMSLDNLKAFSGLDLDRIVTACGSCAFALSEETPRILKDHGMEKEAELFTGNVMEINQVLAEEPGLAGELRPVSDAPAALHHPCHLHIGMGVKEEPGLWLKKAGVELADMEGGDKCCGGGGLFAVKQPELSDSIFKPRQDALVKSGAGTLATSCNGCFIQWRRGLDAGIRVCHPIELVE